MVTAVHHLTAFDTNNLQIYTTASITPSSTTLQLAAVWSTDVSNLETPTLTGNGLTWVHLGGVAYGAIRRLDLYRAMGASPTAGAVTITFPTVQNQNGCGWSFSEFPGADTSGTNGSGAIVQQKIVGNTGGTTTVTMDTAVTSGNATWGAFSMETNGTMTQGSGYTLLGTVGGATPDISGGTEFKSAGAQTADATWSIAFTLAGSAAVEIKSGIDYNLTATATSSTQINLNWDDIAGATSYDIEQDSVQVVTGHSVSSISRTGLTPNTEYDFRVRAVF
jgi:hypothetical protein